MTDIVATESRPSPRPRLRRLITEFPLLQGVALVVLIIWALIRIPGLANPTAIASVLVLAALLGIATIGQTLVVLLGGLDLAVPGYITVGAFAAANLAGGAGWPLGLAILFAVVVCGGTAALAGYVCHRLGVQPLVVTLGLGAILAGGTLFISGGQFLSAPPQELRDLTRVTATTFGLPIPPIVVIWILATIIISLFLARTPAGRRLYATGANPRAAALTRIRTRRVWVSAFAVNGAVSAVAGVFIAAFSAGSSVSIGEPYLFTGLAAVLIGGTTFGSVHGSYGRTVIGALLLTVLSTILIGEGFTEGEARTLYGFVILAVMVVYGRERALRDRF
ncbi:ABC transporter permease [uncultured Microbacterium sp.]|uniref:ABC transporter permease n=1 Tax=uncultured Microbacterium sp. TaxID=191216 RepID=UPI0028D2B013|nr:ABC transporter permease [uncultured Microbacterium sp.]